MKDALSFILVIIAAIGMITCVGYIQVQHNKQTEDYCNNQYGVNGWELNETTGTDINKHYIGEIWTCVPISNYTPKSNKTNKGFNYE